MSRSASVALLVILLSPLVGAAAIVDVIVGPGGALTFEPVNGLINVGDTVRWTWESGGHNVGSGVHGAPTPFFLSGPPEPAGTVFEVLFDQAFLSANPVAGNAYDYHCHPHGDLGMVGSIIVVPEPLIALQPIALLPLLLLRPVSRRIVCG